LEISPPKQHVNLNGSRVRLANVAVASCPHQRVSSEGWLYHLLRFGVRRRIPAHGYILHSHGHNWDTRGPKLMLVLRLRRHLHSLTQGPLSLNDVSTPILTTTHMVDGTPAASELQPPLPGRSRSSSPRCLLATMRMVPRPASARPPLSIRLLDKSSHL